MDIVNWSALQNNLLVRDTLNSPDDLVLIGANATWNKRGDKFQTYAVPVSALGGGGSPITLQTNTVNNTVQNILDLVDGNQISLIDNGDGSVIVSYNSGVFKQVDPGVSVTGNTSLNITYTQTIPAQTYVNGDVIRLRFRAHKAPLPAGFTEMRVYINTTPTIGGTLCALGRITYAIDSDNKYGQLIRDLVINNSGQTFFIETKGPEMSDNVSGISFETKTINWNIQQYFVFALQNNISTDTATGVYYCIEKI
jgi:hypothetical protein